MKWYLYNTKTSQKIAGQGEEELIRLAYALGEAALWNWVAHVEGHNGWKRMREMGLHLRYTLNESEAYPPTPKQKLADDIAGRDIEGFQGNSIQEQESKKKKNVKNQVLYTSHPDGNLIVDENTDYQVREFERYEERYRVIIEANGKSFETFSQDISVGGVLLEDPVPDWVVGYCNIKIIKPQKREEVQLMCSLVESDDPTKARFRVALAPLKSLEDESVLDDWLAAG
ncbi:MAG: PilZ domain-containing protein [Bdellovibrionales bacterium]